MMCLILINFNQYSHIAVLFPLCLETMCWAKIKIYQDFFGLEAFGGIFDAAATGQYWVGIDLLNDNQNTKFFKNENSD